MAKKLTTYIIIMSGMLLIFYFMGLISFNDNPLLIALLNPQSLTASQFYITLIGSVAIGLVSIGIGILYRDFDKAVMTTIISGLIIYLWNFWAVFTKVRAENEFIAIMVFSPIMFLFVLTMFEMWRGME